MVRKTKTLDEIIGMPPDIHEERRRYSKETGQNYTCLGHFDMKNPVCVKESQGDTPCKRCRELVGRYGYFSE